MKKIEEKMAAAVKSRRAWSESNTSVIVNLCPGEIRVYLFGNCIYRKNGEGEFINLCGWPTVTTYSRLRALGVDICSRQYSPVLRGVGICPKGWYNAKTGKEK